MIHDLIEHTKKTQPQNIFDVVDSKKQNGMSIEMLNEELDQAADFWLRDRSAQ